jgi:hypothetical protein
MLYRTCNSSVVPRSIPHLSSLVAYLPSSVNGQEGTDCRGRRGPMRILNGWKEIAECLHRTSRSARRWEQLGLPVRRISQSSRSPVVAFPNEIEAWVRRNRLRGWGPLGAEPAGSRATRRKSVALNPDVRELRERLERMRKLCEENKRLRADVMLAKENLWKRITLSFPQSKWDAPGSHTNSSLLW